MKEQPTQHIAIVGATSLIAEHCARLWVREPVQLTLAGRDLQRLQRIADDLKVRNPKVEIYMTVLDFNDAKAIEDFVGTLYKGSAGYSGRGGVDIALIAHGLLPDQTACERDLAVARSAIEVNAVSPALFAEAFARQMAARGRGTLAVIGSVAGDRGRRSNYVYGAAKAFVDRYLEGMRHRFAGTGVDIVLIKPGPTDTPMTAHMQLPGIAFADPAQVAGDIVRGIAGRRAVIYTPRRWRWIMLVIRHLPGFIFHKMKI